MIHIQYILLMAGRFMTACFVGFAAGYLLIEKAETWIHWQLCQQKTFRLETGEACKRKSAILMAILTGLLFSGGSPGGLVFRNWLFCCLLFLSAYVDHFIYLIPNEEILLGLFIWGLWGICMGTSFLRYLLDVSLALLFAGVILLVVLLMERWRKYRMLGRGDIKLLFLAALFLGAEKALYVLALACICAILIIVTRRRKTRIPLGPCIAFACFFALFFL